MKYKFMIFAMMIMFSVAYADGMTDFKKLLYAVQSMQADFKQTIYDNKGKKIQQSNGEVSFQRPGYFRWEVKKPIPQIIGANNSRLWIYDPDLAQVTIRSLKGASGETPALLLSHSTLDLAQHYLVKSITTERSGQWFELIPKKSDQFASIQIGFDHGTLTEMRLLDNLGHTTQIRFINVHTNNKLSSTLFIFKAKPGIDVIDETR